MQLDSFTPRVFRFSCKELKKRRGNGDEKYLINDFKKNNKRCARAFCTFCLISVLYHPLKINNVKYDHQIQGFVENLSQNKKVFFSSTIDRPHVCKSNLDHLEQSLNSFNNENRFMLNKALHTVFVDFRYHCPDVFFARMLSQCFKHLLEFLCRHGTAAIFVKQVKCFPVLCK